MGLTEKDTPPNYCVVSFSGEICVSAKAFSGNLWLNLNCSFDKRKVCGKTQHLGIQVSCPQQKRVSCFGQPSLSSLPTLKRLSREEPFANQCMFSVLVIRWLSLLKDRSPNLGQVWRRRGKKEKGWGVKTGRAETVLLWMTWNPKGSQTKTSLVQSIQIISILLRCFILFLLFLSYYIEFLDGKLWGKLHLGIVVTGYFHDFLFPFL